VIEEFVQYYLLFDGIGGGAEVRATDVEVDGFYEVLDAIQYLVGFSVFQAIDGFIKELQYEPGWRVFQAIIIIWEQISIPDDVEEQTLGELGESV
jgi:hypothetical protein